VLFAVGVGVVLLHYLLGIRVVEALIVVVVDMVVEALIGIVYEFVVAVVQTER